MKRELRGNSTNAGLVMARRRWLTSRGARPNGATREKSNGVSADERETDRVRERLLEALANYPEAKQALRDALAASGRL